MRRPVAHDAEICHRIDDAVSKVVHPDAVANYAGSQRILHNRLGQFQAAASLCKWQWLAASLSEDGREAARRLFAERMRAAAQVDLHVRRLGIVLETHQVRILPRKRFTRLATSPVFCHATAYLKP
jgi:hypothetical protein